jgi:heat shock protein HspQ
METKQTKQTKSGQPVIEVVYEFQPTAPARFQAGQLVRSRSQGFRGVVVDVHARFSGAPEWYERMTEDAPDQNQPWYELLVHDAQRMSYVAEESLEADYSGLPVNHPMVRLFFTEFGEGRYRVGGPAN